MLRRTEMEDIRSNPEEESLEEPEAREEMETLDEATHEPGAQIEQTNDIQTAEAIEASISELTEVANEDVVGTASVSMEAPDPGPHPPPELGTAPSEMPPEMEKSDETVGFKWDESAMVKGSPEFTEQIKSLGGSDEEALDGKGSVAKEDPSPDPDPPDREGMQVLGEEAVLREAPAEEDITAYQKGEMNVQDGMSVEIEGSGSEPDLGGIAKDPEFPGGADPDLSGIGEQPGGGGGGDVGGDPDLGGIGNEPDGRGTGPEPDIHKAGMDPDPVD
jgi:hypothetical protein